MKIRRKSMRTVRDNEVLGVDVLAEINAKVTGEITRVYRENGPDFAMTPEQLATAQNIYFAALAPRVLSLYADQGKNVRGRTLIRQLADVARTEIAVRRIALEDGLAFDMPQLSDEAACRALEAEGFGSMHVPRHGWSEEDFRFGITAYGMRPTDQKLDPFFNDEWATTVARQEFKPSDDLVETLARLPRKHMIKDQAYVLDVDETLKAAGLHSASAGYMSMHSALEAEAKDPVKQDELRKLYAGMEFAAVNDALDRSENILHDNGSLADYIDEGDDD